MFSELNESRQKEPPIVAHPVNFGLSAFKH